MQIKVKFFIESIPTPYTVQISVPATLGVIFMKAKAFCSIKCQVIYSVEKRKILDPDEDIQRYSSDTFLVCRRENESELNKVVDICKKLAKLDSSPKTASDAKIPAYPTVPVVSPATPVQIFGCTAPSSVIPDDDISNNDIFRTIVHSFNMFEKPIYIKEMPCKDDEFLVFSTINYDCMINPTKIKLDFSSNYNKTLKAIQTALKIPSTSHVLLYLSSGVPFVPKLKGGKENTIGKLFQNAHKLKHHIYVVVYTSDISDDALNREIDEICDVSSEEKKKFISPNSNSTNIGYSRMACLLGTIQYHGDRSLEFIKGLALSTGFAPLITGLKSLYLSKQPITVRTLVTITASLYCIFSSLTQSIGITSENILDYCLHCSCFIAHHPEIQECELIIPSFEINSKSPDPLMSYLNESNIKGTFYQYNPDIGTSINISKISLSKRFNITHIFKSYRAYKPIPALSVRFSKSSTIIQYKNKETLLFVSEDSSLHGEGSIKYINPFKGKVENAQVERISEDVIGSSNDIDIIINPADIREIIEIAVDASGSMKATLNGNTWFKKKTDDTDIMKKYFPMDGNSRIVIAIESILTLINRAFGFRLPQLYGLSSFGDSVIQHQTFTPLSSKLENSSKQIRLSGKTFLWDAVDAAIDKLNKFQGTGKYENAKSRILIFCDGDDSGSKANPISVGEKAIKSDIIIDSVILSTKISRKDEFKKLIQLCHLTGGYSFQPTDTEQIYSLFEKESFLSLHLRAPPTPSTVPITDEIFNSLIDEPDINVPNINLITKSQIVALATPSYVMEKNISSYGCPPDDMSDIERRRVRILKELRIIFFSFDDSIKVFVNQNNFDEWMVFIQGPDCSDYKNHLWYLTIDFTTGYPIEPPCIHFITIPYHLNVTEDGFVCANFLYSEYQSSDLVYDLIKKVQNLLERPDINSPVQTFKRFYYNENKSKYKEEVFNSCKDVPSTFEEYLTFHILDSKYIPDIQAFESCKTKFDLFDSLGGTPLIDDDDLFI